MDTLKTIELFLNHWKTIASIIVFVMGFLGYGWYESNGQLTVVKKDLVNLKESANKSIQSIVAYYSGQDTKPKTVQKIVVREGNCTEQCKQLVDEHINSWRHK